MIPSTVLCCQISCVLKILCCKNEEDKANYTRAIRRRRSCNDAQVLEIMRALQDDVAASRMVQERMHADLARRAGKKI